MVRALSVVIAIVVATLVTARAEDDRSTRASG